MASKSYPVIFAALLACVAVNAAAQTVYKNVDDEGRTTFTDQPPAQPSGRLATPRRGGKVDMTESARRLKQARLERTLGAAPAPGELNRGPGAPTVNHRYWQRQEKLRIVVERALRRSNETGRLIVASR
jgi:hypothetical protein